MFKMKKLLLYLLLILISCAAFSQKFVDSLSNKLKNTNNDTLRIEILLDLATTAQIIFSSIKNQRHKLLEYRQYLPDIILSPLRKVFCHECTIFKK